jgi:hypothetical protein
MRPFLPALAFAMFWLASSGAGMTGAWAGPEITAQGFDISLPREGRLGRFDRLRIRVEAPDRIKELSITERSYQVDLATTLDTVNYRLFGIEKRLRLHKDVTLNFQTYINEKIAVPGTYEFLIRVKDHEDGVATARLPVIVAAPEEPTAEREVKPLKTGVFRLVRAGPGQVTGAEDLGITWKTIDEVAVVIRIKGPSEETAFTGKLAALDYDKISDIADLPAPSEPETADAPSAYVDLPTANNAAAGRVLAIDTAEKYYLMKLDKSETSLSPTGTTVVLEGEYKYFEK